MKTNIYIFSNSILSRKDSSFALRTIPETEPIHQIEIFEGEDYQVLLPAPKSDDDSDVKYIPAESVEAFYTFGEVRFNTQLFKCLNIYKIPLHMFNYYGNYIGSFIPANNEGSGEIQILQFKAYLDYKLRLKIAKSIQTSAIKNIVSLLKSYAYSGADLDEPIAKISSILDQIRFADSVDELLGYEGIARNIYYSSWSEIFTKDVNFIKRIKKPPIGMINSLISFGNSMLYSACFTEIYRTRLNPFIGFIHETGDNKHPLVYDISEIFKPIIVDRVIFRVINLNMIDETDFKQTSNGLYLKDEARKKFVEEFENRLSTVIHHKDLNRKVSYRSLIRMECYNLINFLSGKLKDYEPYRSN